MQLIVERVIFKTAGLHKIFILPADFREGITKGETGTEIYNQFGNQFGIVEFQRVCPFF